MRKSGGIPRRARLAAPALIWTAIPLSALLLTARTPIRVIMLAVAAALTVCLLRLPGRDDALKERT